MSKLIEKNLPISRFRAWSWILMPFCQKVPGLHVERPMKLAPLIAARQAAIRPSWCAIFLKAMTWWPRVAGITTFLYAIPWAAPARTSGQHRQLHHRTPNFEGEDVVFFVQVRSPEKRTLAELDQLNPHLQGTAGRIGQVLSPGDPARQGALAFPQALVVVEPDFDRQTALPQLRDL